MADPLNPFANPFGPAFGQLPNPFAAPKPPALPLPELSPEQQSSLLGRVGEESLGGLAYLGKLLDKLTLARPVRGLLGGRPEEALSFLPFSDTVGLTQERNVVHGTDLLEQAGLITPGDDSFENLAAGVAAEILTDPATLTGGAFVKPLLKGYGKAAQYVGKGLGKGVEYATGGHVNPYTFGGKVAERAGRQAGALFDRTAQGATSVGGQALAREVYTPALDAGLAAARQDWANPLVELRQFATGPGRNEQKLFDALTWRAEDFLPEGEAALRAAGYADPEIARIHEIFDPYLARVRGTQPREAALGAAAPALDNVPDWVKVGRQEAADAGLPDPFPTFRAPGYNPRQLADFEGGTFKGRVGRLTGGGPHSLEREDVFRGVPTPVVQAWSRSPALTGADRTLNDLQAKHEIVRQLVPGGNATHPAYKQAEDIADRLFGLDPRVRQTGLYSDDVLGAGLGRLEQEATTVASERTVMEGIKRFAKPLTELQAAGVRAVPVPSFLAKTKFTGDPAREKAAGLLGLDPATAGGVDQMRAFGLPEDVANDMLRMGEAIKTPAVLAPVVAAWDWTLNLFKTSLTTIFPAFHARNMMSGLFNMWRDRALSVEALDQSQKLLRGGGLYPEVAAKLYPGLPFEQANKEFLKEVIANKVAFVRGSRQTSDVTGAVGLDRMLPSQVPEVGGAVRGVGEDVGNYFSEMVPNKGRVFEELVNPLNQAGVNRETDVNRLVDAGRKLGNTTEDFVRLGHYIAKRQAGASAEEATAATMKYQIDYTNLSGTEKAVFRRIFPWYSYSRRSLPVVLEDLVNRPAKLAGAMRFATNMRDPYDYVPDFVAEGASVAAPAFMAGPEGHKRYFTSLGLPFEDEAIKTLASGLRGDVSRVGQQLFGMAVPWLKVPAEVATGTQMFSGRRLEDLRPYEFMTAGGLIPEDLARQATQVVANTPFSRLASSADKLIDDRKGLGPTAANLLTGVRISDVDEAKMREVAAREALKDALRGTPGVRVREDVYVPRELQPQLNPYQLDLLAVLKAQEKKVAEQQKARQAAGR